MPSGTSAFKCSSTAAALLLLCLGPLSFAGASEDALTLADVSPLPSARVWFPSDEHPAIDYAGRRSDDAMALLMRRIAESKTSLQRDDASGYLTSLLAALKVSQDSQMLVFSKTSLQRQFISPQTPRAIFFSDEVVVAHTRGAPLIEVAAQDPRLGMVYYVVDQNAAGPDTIRRETACLRCHASLASVGVPGNLIRSVGVRANGAAAQQVANFNTDHRSPMAERWGGWFVDGIAGAKHMGNLMLAEKGADDSVFVPVTKPSTLIGYPSPHSDAAALLVFNHQMHLMNLLIRIGWDARIADFQEKTKATTPDVTAALLASDAREIADYMLFVDEAPLTGQVAESAFAKSFSASALRDGQGRSLRDLDLRTRLLRYPCSYLMYSRAFEALPAPARAAIYSRIAEILTGKDRDARYAKLTPVIRGDISAILRSTKPEIGAYLSQ